jgi:xanthine dehydrogenase accessory factor
MSEDVIAAAERWVGGGSRVALAVVVGTRRSAPRPIGTKMAIGDRGEISGAVSGGCVEGAVVEEAERMLEGGGPRLLSYGFSDEEAWDVGLQCGGEIDVWIEPYRPPADAGAGDDSPDALTAAFAESRRAGERAALVTVMGGQSVGAKILVRPEGRVRGTTGDPELDRRAVGHAGELMWGDASVLRRDGEDAFFVDVCGPPPRLFVFGAVDYAAALCAVARVSGWTPYVVDPRARFAQPERFPQAEAVVAAWPAQAFERLGGIDRATAIVVLTHDPKLDDAALDVALASDASYIGAMGSRNAQRARRERLLERGVAEDELARISAPVGLDLGAVTAQETALSIMAEIVALRRGRAGGRLVASKERIHAAVAS